MFLIKAKNAGILNVFRVFLTQSKGKPANLNRGSDFSSLPKYETELKIMADALKYNKINEELQQKIKDEIFRKIRYGETPEDKRQRELLEEFKML